MLVFVCFFFTPAPCHAGINKWTAVSPEGGTVFALAIDPQNPETIYSGTDKGIFKSTDGGGNWNFVGLTNMGFLDGSIQTLVLDPLNPTIIYAGTYHLFKSIDGGTNWIDISWRSIQTLAIDPEDPNIVYIGTRDSSYNAFKSIDGGANWESVNSGLVWKDNYGTYSVYIRTLTIDPINPTNIYAGTNRGVFKSVNGAANWVPANNGLPITQVGTLTIHPTDPNTLYATLGSSIYKWRSQLELYRRLLQLWCFDPIH